MCVDGNFVLFWINIGNGPNPFLKAAERSLKTYAIYLISLTKSFIQNFKNNAWDMPYILFHLVRYAFLNQKKKKNSKVCNIDVMFLLLLLLLLK